MDKFLCEWWEILSIFSSHFLNLRTVYLVDLIVTYCSSSVENQYNPYNIVIAEFPIPGRKKQIYL